VILSLAESLLDSGDAPIRLFQFVNAPVRQRPYPISLVPVNISGMKLRDDGKEHEVGNSRCRACDQRTDNGRPLTADARPFPQLDTTGNPPCGGFFHAEIFRDRFGSQILYLCDRCGGSIWGRRI